MKPPLNRISADDFQTPKHALNILLPFIKKDWVVWECAKGKGNLETVLMEKRIFTIGTDILTGYDFLTYEPNHFDCIITNPPYSLKDDFLERAYSLGKPFAFLMPLTALEGKIRQNLYQKHGLQMIIPNKRINFETPSGKGSGSWFLTAWYCWGLNLPSDLLFRSFEDIKQTKLEG